MASTRPTSKADNPAKPQSSVWPIVLVVLVGVAGSFACAYLVWQEQRAAMAESFGRQVESRLRLFSERINRYDDLLFTLKTLFQRPVEPTREEFRRAASGLLKRHSAIRALEWVPKVSAGDRAAFEARARADGIPDFEFTELQGRLVRAAERPEHWPIYYVEPMPVNGPALGYDLTTGPTRQFLDLAVDTGDTVVTSRLRLVQGTSGDEAIIGILAVFDPSEPTGTSAQRRGALRGFVQLVCDVQEAASVTVAGAKPAGFDTLLLDNSADAAHRVLAFVPSRLRSTSMSVPSPEEFTGPLVVSVQAKTGERIWEFRARPMPEWLAANSSWDPAVVLAIGLLITGVTIRSLSAAARRTRLVSQQVEARTRELLALNGRLAEEVKERQDSEHALRQSQTRLIEAQRIGNIGSWETDLETGVLTWSDQTYRIFGRQAGEFRPTTESFLASLPEPDRAPVQEAVRRALEGKLRYHVEHRVRLPDGTERVVQEHAEVIQGDDGRPRKLAGTVHDITERVRVGEALERERNLLRTLIDSIPDYIAVKDLHDRFVLVNATNVRALGLTDPREAVGRTDHDFFPAECADLYVADDRRVLASGQPVFNREEPFAYADGTKGWFLTSKLPLRDAEGRVTGILCISRDITERKGFVETLARERNLLRTLLDTLPESIYVKDAGGRYLLTNEANRAFLGLSSSGDVVGKTVFDLMPPEHAARYDADNQTVIRTGQAVRNREEPARFPGGKEGTLLTNKLPLFDGQGNVIGLVGVSRDITEQRRVAEEQETLDRKLQETQKLESLGVLAGGIAHDFNNILTTVLGYSNLARLELTGHPTANSHLAQIEQGALRAAELCKQMLAYSGKGHFVVQKVDLSRLVEETTTLLRLSITKRAVLRFELASGLPPVTADVTQLRQIIMNLVINASDAIGERSGVIHVSTGLTHADRAQLAAAYLATELPEGSYVYLEVRDNGAGMDAATLARIFEPFFTTKFTGRGLGLAAVLGIVRGHKGAIRVDSEPGRGTTFRLLLPLAEGDASPLSSVPTPVGPWRGEGTVLIVDDEETVRSTIARIVRLFGLDPVQAADGAEAIERFRADPGGFAAVLLDLTMPHMDGARTFQELQRIRPGVPVLVMSGFSEQDVGAAFTGKGFAGFVQKPFPIEVLRERLKQILGPDQATQSSGSG